MRALFPPEALDQVAGVIQARRRRVLSPEAARQKGARTAYRAGFAPPEPTEPPTQGGDTAPGDRAVPG